MLDSTQPPDPWFVYFVQCADGSLYTGISNDVRKRIENHNSGNGAKYTKGRLPVKLVHTEKLSSKSEASIREAELKKLSRDNKIKLIKLRDTIVSDEEVTQT